ncbi:unnamed protein product [Agarophyton chilense]
MKQRIVLSEKLRTSRDTSHEREHPLRRSARFSEVTAVGTTPQDRVNRTARIDRTLGAPLHFYSRNGVPQHVPPFPPSPQVRAGRPQWKAGIEAHVAAAQAETDHHEREGMYAGEPKSFKNSAIDAGHPKPARVRPSTDHMQHSFCLDGMLASGCSSKVRYILQLLCTASLILLALHFTSTDADFTSGSRSFLYDALPWVFRASNVSAQQIRSKAMWESHVVLSEDNRILIPETFESRWNAEVAPLVENQLHRIWDELPKIQCWNGEQTFAAFSLKESESLPATVSYGNTCNRNTLYEICTRQKQVDDLRQLSIDLPSKSSRSSYSVNVTMKRLDSQTDVTGDPDVVVREVKGIVQFHLSDSAKVALVRYCSDRRHHFSDNIAQTFAPSNNVRLTISLYELKRVYALISRNRKGASYFTELWDANELSRATLDPVEHSWHPLTRTNEKQFRLPKQDSFDGQKSKPPDTSEYVVNNGEIDSVFPQPARVKEQISSERTVSLNKGASTSNNSSRWDMNQKNNSDVSELQSQRVEKEYKSSFSGRDVGTKTDGDEGQRENQDEDEALSDIAPEADESDDDDDSSLDAQGQDETAEKQGAGNLLPNEQYPDGKQEPATSETTDSAFGTKPRSFYDPPHEVDRGKPQDTGSPSTARQYPANNILSPMRTEETERTNQERSLANLGNESEIESQGAPLPQSSLPHPREEEIQQQISQQQDPNFHLSTQGGLLSQTLDSPVGRRGTQPEQSQSRNENPSPPSLPRINDSGPPSRGAPMQARGAEQQLESVESIHVPPRASSPMRIDQSLQGSPSRIGGAESSQKHVFPGTSSPMRMRNPQEHRVEKTPQASSMGMRGVNVQQNNQNAYNVPQPREQTLPRPPQTAGTRNQLRSRGEPQLQIHSRRTSEVTRNGRPAIESRATTPSYNQQLNTMDASSDVVIGRSAFSQSDMPRFRQNTGPLGS